MALHEKGLGIYRPGADHRLSRTATLGGFTNAWGVRASGTTVFVADGVGGLVTIDATSPAAPRVLGRVVTGGQARDVAVEGRYVYVAAGSAGLVIVDVSDLANPTVVSSTRLLGTAVRLDYSAGRVFVAAWNDARVYDVSDPKVLDSSARCG